MKELLELLSDGNARTVRLLAIELGTSVEDVKREIEYLTNIGVIKKVDMSLGCGGNCGSCSDGCSGSCASCMPQGGFKNMGEMYEVCKS